jgi:pilus assembly protein TadC
MKIFSLLCISMAAYLAFPLPKAKAPKAKIVSPEKELVVEFDTKAATSSEILSALEIIRLGISAGMTLSDALEYAQKRSPLAASRELEQGLNQFRVGFPLARGLEKMATENLGWRAISDTLITSLDSGTPVANQLDDVEFVLQSSIDTEKLKRIKSVAVKSVLPLGLCFLPAFILLAIIPIIAGLIGGLTQ